MRLSKARYGAKDNLGRFWYEKYNNIQVGKYTYGYQYMYSDNLQSIGSFCSIAPIRRIVPNDHRMDFITTSPIVSLKRFGFVENNYVDNKCISDFERKIVIGNDVWIGADCIIFEGVKIGDGAVIAAGSVIRKDVPPYAVVGGVDRILKFRFPQEVIEKMLSIQWWNWSEEKIKANVNFMYEPEKFINKFYEEDKR